MSVFQSIKGKFLTFVLCISLIPFIIVITIYYLHARNILKYKTLEELRTIVKAKRLNVVSLMEKLKIRTVDFSSDGFIRNTYETIIRTEDSQQDGEIKRLNRYLLKHKIPIYQHLKAIIITDTYGKIISSTQENLVGNTISPDSIYLKVSGKDFGEVYVSQPRYYPYLNANCISVSAPVISIHGAHSLGVIINVYSLSALNEITADRTGMGKTGEVYLINKDKIMLTESRFIDNAPLKQVVDTEPVRKIIEDGEEVVGVYKDYRGRFVVGALMNIPDYDWVLFSEVDRAEIFGPLRGLRSIALILGISSFCVITSMSIVFVVSIVKPINKLIYVTKRFARGDLDYRVEVIGKDEVGELANSFNIMAKGLAREIAGHKRAEEALKDSEQKFRAIFDNAKDGILLADIETKQFFLGNKAICQLLGYSHGEIKGLKVMDIHPEKDLSSVIENFEKQVRGEIVLAGDIPVKRKDGSVFYADISSALIILGGKAYLIGIFRDITERKQTEEILQKSRLSLANAQKIANLGNWEWNIVKNELWWSDEIYRIFGLSPQVFSATYEAFLDFVHPDDRELVKRSVNEAFYQKKPYSIDHRIVLPDGSMRTVHEEAEVIFDDTGRAIQMNGTVHDITERKRAEETLRISEHKYRLLLENLPQRIFYKDKNSIYISCNENLARDLHIKPDEIAGKTDYDFYPKELAEKYRASDKRVMKSGQTKDREEEYIKNGRELIIHTVRTPIRDEKGDIIGILGIFWDITEKVALQREAIRNRHLVALGELATGIGHEINNPMTGIINCAQILSNKSKEGSKERDIAQRIIKESDRVINIVHSLLSFARIEDRIEKKSIVSIQEVLSDTLILAEAQLRKEGIKIKVDISPNLPRIHVYPQQIQQVFLNIISNARYALNQKYPEAHDDKILEILGEEIPINNCPYVKITFHDHGIGIPANIIHKVLDPFFTMKPRHKATGLGLSISHSIIKDHGGEILIESVEGEFTKVIIVLPSMHK